MAEAKPEGPGERIGARLRTLRERGLYTRRELAKKSGVAPSTIEGLEMGLSARPRRSTIDKLAKALGVEAEAIMYGPEDGPDAPLGEARLLQLQERRLHEVRERFAPIAAKLDHYCETFEEQVAEGSLTQEDLDQFLLHLPPMGAAMGKAYTDELRAIAEALDLADRAGERVVRDGISKERATTALRVATHPHSVMYAALKRYYAVGEALAESVGDAEAAEQIDKDKARALEAA